MSHRLGDIMPKRICLLWMSIISLLLTGCQTDTIVIAHGSQEQMVMAIKESTLSWCNDQIDTMPHNQQIQFPRIETQPNDHQIISRYIDDLRMVIFDWQWQPDKTDQSWRVTLHATQQIPAPMRPMNCVAFPFPLCLITTPVEWLNNRKTNRDYKPKRQIELEKQLISDFQEILNLEKPELKEFEM